MKISGFTVAKNVCLLGYPVKEAIESILPLCDELVVNIGDCTDDTEEYIRSIKTNKLKFIHNTWNPNNKKKGTELSIQTNLALKECSGDWGIYIQADECIHENTYENVIKTLSSDLPKTNIDGYNSKYYHFWGDYDHLMPDTMHPYTTSMRIIRIGAAESVGDACGFRALRKWHRLFSERFRANDIDMPIYHYGYVRTPEQMWMKDKEFHKLYHKDKEGIDSIPKEEYGKMYINPKDSNNLFLKSHPKVMETRIREFKKEIK